jgi:ubiquinone/menaquinone biosynthesis C-methylase UbiE
MPLFKATDIRNAYRMRALTADINNMSGRYGRPDLTRFVSQQTVDRLQLQSSDVLVDVGCGDGTLLAIAASLGDKAPHRMIGVLPTEEEVARTQDNLRVRAPQVEIVLGDACSTGLPDGCATKLVCNGVLICLMDEAVVDRALMEMKRIAQQGATFLVGEQPHLNEVADRTYSDSILSWLWWELTRRGLMAAINSTRTVVRSTLFGKMFNIPTRKIFWMPPGPFAAKLSSAGFRVLEHCPHPEVDREGRPTVSTSRTDYVTVRE